MTPLRVDQEDKRGRGGKGTWANGINLTLTYTQKRRAKCFVEFVLTGESIELSSCSLSSNQAR